jgi:predicted nucleotidyltransferase
MTGLPSILQSAAARLAQRGVPWALVGGWAVSVWTEPRFTRDVDLAVAVANDDFAESLIQEFRSAGYQIQASVEQDAVGRLATVRLKPPRDEPGVLLDLLFASSGIELEVCRRAEFLEILPGLKAPIARPEHLLALKILSRDDRTRPQDVADIRALIVNMDENVRRETEIALDLITARGYHRGRNLRHLFDEAIASFRG